MIAMSEERKYSTLNETLSRFWFVGAHTDCDRLIAAIATDLKVPSVASCRNTAEEWHKRVEWQPVNADKLSVVSREAILTNSPIDQAYGKVGARLGSRQRKCAPARSSGPGLAGYGPTTSPASPSRALASSGAAGHPESKRVYLKSIAKMEPGLEWGARKGGSELLAALDADPDSPQIWRAILTRCQQTRIAPPIPGRLIGCPDQVTDPELRARHEINARFGG